MTAEVPRQNAYFRIKMSGKPASERLAHKPRKRNPDPAPRHNLRFPEPQDMERAESLEVGVLLVEDAGWCSTNRPCSKRDFAQVRCFISCLSVGCFACLSLSRIPLPPNNDIVFLYFNPVIYIFLLC